MQSEKIKLLENLKKQIRLDILKEYRSIEEFCYISDINKSILSKFFANKRDMKVSTLCRMAMALNKKVKII